MSERPLTTIGELSAASDAQLSELMGKSRRSDGAFELHVDGDWTKLSKEDRDQLARRLRATAANSHSLDLDKLDTLLRDVCNNGEEALSKVPSRQRVTESPLDEDYEDTNQQDETEAYYKLLNDGGRPLFPINLLGTIFENPSAHYEILKPFWRENFDNVLPVTDLSWQGDILHTQWLRWSGFRNWQCENRKIDAKYDAFRDLVDENTRISFFHQKGRSWHRRYQLEFKCETLSDYEEWLKARLARHGFVRTFSLQKDPTLQDKLTEWVEYLGFEYWWLDYYTSLFERSKLKHDRSWEALKRLGILKDHETPDFVRTDISLNRRISERDRAMKALQDATSETQKTCEKIQGDSRIRQEQTKRLQAAQKALDFAKKRVDHIGSFVRGTYDYVKTKKAVAFQKNLLEWAVTEAHSIEAELKAASLQGGRQKKRKAASENSRSSKSKRQKPNAQKLDTHLSNGDIGTGVLGHGSQRGENEVEGKAPGRRVLRRRTRPATDNTQHQGQIGDTWDTKPGGRSSAPREAAQKPIPVLRRSSRLAALKLKAESRLAT